MYLLRDRWEAGLTMHDKLMCGSSSKRNHRATQGHRFDHHHAKGLFPLDWIEKAARAALEQTEATPRTPSIGAAPVVVARCIAVIAAIGEAAPDKNQDCRN